MVLEIWGKNQKNLSGFCLWTIVVLMTIVGHNCDKTSLDWEIAVVAWDQIELLQSNGALIGSTVKQFRSLKGLAFDNVRRQFLVSDTDQSNSNDTIYAVHLTKETEITPIITDLPDDIQSLALDPIEDVLYWTNLVNMTINYAYLNDTTYEPRVLFQFDDAKPRDIAIDVCRRYIYWTNREIPRPTIERAFLNGSNREVLIDSDLSQPSGITIDHKTHRIYWADKREGIDFRIDSADLDGNKREIVYEGVHINPYGIAVDESSIYWTDINNNALWRILKMNSVDTAPEKIRQFQERPWGIVANNIDIRNYPDCKELELLIEEYEKNNGAIEEDLISIEPVKENPFCLNGGELKGSFCACKRGFTGQYCEKERCHNFCLHGTCHLSPTGYAQCICPLGFAGSRCEKDKCSTYCLNGGTCQHIKGQLEPVCTCPGGIAGKRCQRQADFHGLCDMYCSESVSRNSYLVSKDRKWLCSCENGVFSVSKNNQTLQTLYAESSPFYDKSFVEKLTMGGDYSIMVIALISLVLLNVALIIYHCRTRPKRPIIKKRVIVNRNVTPLTYRPQPTTEQCEITIENCCNMNVCETPCFEPSSFRNKNKEDKKVLLAAMEENGEETS